MMTTKLLDNRYKILKTLARGGFGETYLAVDTRMPSGKQCVIKKLKAIVDVDQDPQWFAARFEREATILEKLGESNKQIPRLYAYFCEAGNYYLVQEWIEGLTLTQKQQKVGQLAEAEVKKILSDILPVLSYVHDRQIVHRDIKPDNIILRERDNKPVLIDFGAVKEAMTAEAEGSKSVMLSVAIGTPGYMPSEQAAGRPLYSSDLYSLGMTAIYLLTGKIPQNLETDSNTGEIIWQKHRRLFDRNLARVIEKAIRFHPRDRFTSAREMLAAIDNNEGNPTIATVAVAPARSQAKPRPTNHSAVGTSATNVAAIDRPPAENPLKLPLFLLIFAGIGLGSFLFGSSLYGPESKINQTPDSQTTQKPEKPLPDSSQTPIISKDSDTLPFETEEPEETKDNNNSDIIDRQPEEQPERSKPVYSRDQRPKRDRNPSDRNTERVPIFIVGENKDRIIARLGKPTLNQKGYFGDTRAISYLDFVPDRVNLGYVYDTHTGRVRQTGVSFDRQSVDIKVMEQTLTRLLQGNAPEHVKEALKEVYSGRTDMRSFRIGNYKATIQKERRRDSIYIAVWDADFH